MTHQSKIPPAASNLTSRARRLRREMTVPERLLWGRLRDRRLAGLRFTRQKVLGSFIADFYCAAAKLVVEVDGMSHDGTGERDRHRTVAIQKMGLHVLRVTNDDVCQDMEATLRYIHQEACPMSAHQPTNQTPSTNAHPPLTPPSKGGG